MLLEEGMNVKIVLLPEGEDPDSFARKHNSFDFMLYIKEHETDFIRFKADLLLKGAGNDPIKRANLIRDIMASVAIIPDNIVRSVYIKECSQLLDEREQVLLDEVIKTRNRKRNATQSNIKKADDNNATAQGTSEANTTIITREASNDRLPQKMLYPFKKYESVLIRYVIRYGERVLFEQKEDDNTQANIKVAEYIRMELANDDIEMQSPVYKRILEEAAALCHDETFVASHYFLTHTDLEISEIASNMISNRYQLSKFFDNRHEALKLTRLTDEQQKTKNETQKLEKERMKLEQWVVQEVFELKNAYIKREIDTINKQIKELQSDEEALMTLLKKRMELDKIKHLLSQELGFRVVTGIK